MRQARGEQPCGGGRDRRPSRFLAWFDNVLFTGRGSRSADINWFDPGYWQDNYKFGLTNASHSVVAGAISVSR